MRPDWADVCVDFVALARVEAELARANGLVTATAKRLAERTIVAAECLALAHGRRGLIKRLIADGRALTEQLIELDLADIAADLERALGPLGEQ